MTDSDQFGERGVERGLLLRYPPAGWAKDAHALLYPGGHAAVYGGTGDALEAEDAGFEVRNCLFVLGVQQHKVWLFRRPCAEPTVANQLLKTGTGALWIAGCRVGTDSTKRQSTAKMGYGGRNLPGRYQTGSDSGRWPANLLLVHTPACQQEGTKRVRGTHSYGKDPGFYGSPNRNTYGVYKGNKPSGYVAEDGLETVPSWDCPPDCLVRVLDAQSGETGSIKALRGRSWYSEGEHEGWKSAAAKNYAPTVRGFEDSGGASRFFPQFQSEDELDDWLLRLILGP